MSAPNSTTTRVPSIGRRRLARGSALGVGLLVAAGAFAPAALADDETTGDTPAPEADLGTGEVQPVPINEQPVDGNSSATQPGASLEGFFGSGKSVDFQVTYDDTTAPSGLDLSGAVFTLTGNGGTYSCTTDVTGHCSVSTMSEAGPAPAGSYAVTQTGHAVGLSAATGVGSVHFCDWMDFFMRVCPADPFEPVVNDSLFRSPVVTSVEDSLTGGPVDGAGYTLTGPGYLIQPGLRDAGASYPGDGSPQTVRAASAADGSLTFPGWFLADTGYVLAPDGAVDGYLADAGTTGIEIEPSTGALPVSLAPRRLAPVAVPGPVDPIVPAPTPTTAPVSPPSAAPAVGRAPAGGARSGRVAAPVAAVPAPEPVAAEPSSPPAPPATRTFDRSGAAEPTLAPLAGGTATPALTTVSSAFPDKGLAMALGGVFLVVVLVGIGLVRRHARRRV